MISVAVQAHPARADLAEPLARGLGAEVVYDPDPDGWPNAWRTYRHALERTPAWATHRLIVQDDVTPCARFADAAALAVAARPDQLVVFFVGGRPHEHARAVLNACADDRSWAMLDHNRWCPAVANCWPVTMIEPLLAFVDQQRWPPSFRADDEIIGRFLRAGKLNAWATVPSLVEHEDVVPSLLGKGRHFAGEDWGRVAACMIPPGCDATLIDWRVT